MPIKEDSFRIGSGRYIQGRGYLAKTGEEILRLGTAPLIIGGQTALHLTRGQITESLADKCNKYEFIVHTGTCNEARATELAQLAAQLEKAGNHAAYEQVMAAVSDFEKGNMRLSMVLAALDVQ